MGGIALAERIAKVEAQTIDIRRDVQEIKAMLKEYHSETKSELDKKVNRTEFNELKDKVVKNSTSIKAVSIEIAKYTGASSVIVALIWIAKEVLFK